MILLEQNCLEVLISRGLTELFQFSILILLIIKSHHIILQANHMQSEISAKVVVIGPVGVGKSSITLRYVQNQFNESLDSTLGAVYSEKTHPYQGRKIRLEFWDTAGQEKYKSIARIYYKDCRVALVVYDVTNRNSYEQLKTWVGQLKTNGPQNVIIAIIGNKTDLQTTDTIPYEEVSSYAQELGALFQYTSAKEGKGILQLFNNISQKLIESKEETKEKNSKLKKGGNKKQKKCC